MAALAGQISEFRESASWSQYQIRAHLPGSWNGKMGGGLTKVPTSGSGVHVPCRSSCL